MLLGKLEAEWLRARRIVEQSLQSSEKKFVNDNNQAAALAKQVPTGRYGSPFAKTNTINGKNSAGVFGSALRSHQHLASILLAKRGTTDEPTVRVAKRTINDNDPDAMESRSSATRPSQNKHPRR